MTKTYTYTARDAQDLMQVITITLYPQFARINLTGLWDQLASVGEAEERVEAAGSQLVRQAKPAALKIIEAISGPVHLSDLDAVLDGEQLKLTVWQRLRGLRLAPVTINMEQVDNLDAATAFVEELAERKGAAGKAELLPGPFDYWASWAAALLGAFAVVLLIGRRRS